MRNLPRFLVLCTLLSLLFVRIGTAQQSHPSSNHIISYQGSLLNRSGSPVQGQHELSFTLYSDPEGKKVVWKDSYALTVKDGIFSASLGGGAIKLPSPAQLDGQLWLGVSVDGEQEMRPLTQMGGTLFAFNVADGSITSSKIADGAVTAEKISAPYISAITLNDKRIEGVGAELNLVAKDGLKFKYDAASGYVVLGIDQSYLRAPKGAHPMFVGANWGTGANQNMDDVSTAAFQGVNHLNSVGAGEGNRAGADQVGGLNAASSFNSIIGGEDNWAEAGHATVGGGRLNKAVSQFSFVGGGELNEATNTHATILGGKDNTASGITSTVGGGERNIASNLSTTVLGGKANVASGEFATVGGGAQNYATGDFSFIGGGGEPIITIPSSGNTAVGDHSTIGGGYGQMADGHFTFIGGGDNNEIYSDLGAIGGGKDNLIEFSSEHSVIGGGELNFVETPFGAITGGIENAIAWGSDFSAIGGGQSNVAFGTHNAIPGGSHLETNGFAQTAVGHHNFITNGDRLFHVGNGTAVTRSNAFEIDADGHSIVYGANGPAAPPHVGGTYTDNIIYAWARVNGGGVPAITQGYGVTLTGGGGGIYNFQLQIRDPHTGALITNWQGGSITATLEGPQCAFISSSGLNANGTFSIFVRTMESCGLTSRNFMFKVTARRM